MTRFEYCLARVLEYEGGWVDHPKDPGGPTMQGITVYVYAEYLGIKVSSKIVDKQRVLIRDAAALDVIAKLRNLSREHRDDIYRRNYWDKVKADQLPPGLDQQAFDFAVNSGWSRAAKILQETLGFTGKDVDGMIGPKTLKAVALSNTHQLISAYTDARLAYLKRLGGWPHFGRGWSTRVNKVQKQALAAVASAHA